jgi:hypothetical protein
MSSCSRPVTAVKDLASDHRHSGNVVHRPPPGLNQPLSADSSQPACKRHPGSSNPRVQNGPFCTRPAGKPEIFQEAQADTRAAMTTGSTAVCDQQTAEGAGRGPGEHSDRDARLTDGRCRREAGRRLCAVRADLPGLRQRHRKCVRPRIPGFSPGGLGPHLTSSGSPRGLSSGFPFARRVLPLRPPSSGFPSSGVPRFVPFGRCPGSGSPSVSLRVPFP